MDDLKSLIQLRLDEAEKRRREKPPETQTQSFELSPAEIVHGRESAGKLLRTWALLGHIWTKRQSESEEQD